MPDPVSLEPEHVHDAGVIDAKTGALPVQFEVANPGGQLLVGQHGDGGALHSAIAARVPAVNKAAVLTEAGRPYVLVQSGGERVRPALHRDCRPRRRLGRREERPETRRSRRHPRRLRSPARRRRRRGLPAEGHVH